MLLPTFLIGTIALASATPAIPNLSRRTFIPNNSTSDPVNASIAAYTDAVLQTIAQDAPTTEAYAQVNFTNGVRAQDIADAGAYFCFEELAGTSGIANLTTVVVRFAFPGGLSSTNNIFAYHIHEYPIAADDQTCNSAGPHLDPFMANGTQPLLSNVTGAPGFEGPAFNDLYHPTSGNLSTFQTGDLSGKYGVLTTVDGILPGRQINEHYLRISGPAEYSILGRSVVIHDAPTDTRIACGNITVYTLSQ